MNNDILNLLKPLYLWDTHPVYFAGGHEWSDGTLFLYTKAEKIYLLKIIKPGNEHPFEAVLERQSFMEYLSSNGVLTPRPLRSVRGNIVESVVFDSLPHLVYTWEMIPGEHIELGDPRDCRDFYISWGKMIGKLHRLAKELPDWKHSVSTDEAGTPLICRQREWQHFYHWIQDEEVRKAWQEMNELLDTLPINRENYGFIHNDAHPHNILSEAGKLILIDFDVANYLWFAVDLAICVYSEYSRVNYHSGYSHRNDELAEIFIKPFMQGYESENRLSAEDYATVPIFLRYRRFLMFACFYDQIKTNAPEYLIKFKQEIISHKDYLPSDNYFLGKR